MSISVVINTLNEEKNLPRALASVKNLASEIVVVDMESDDQTVKIAKSAGAKVYGHKRMGYVEPARNFALNKATGDWVLLLDADEEVPNDLAKKLKTIAGDKKSADFYRLPRKNVVFGQWLKYSRWWPDYNIRFFKKEAVSWNETIHSVPETRGEGADLQAQERYALVHHHYQTVEQYLERLNRYTDVQSKDLVKKGYVFFWPDLIRKPTGEFLSRFFAGEGYKDGVHGLALSLLQAFSELIVYVKVWEIQKFKQETLKNDELAHELEKSMYEIDHWLQASGVRKYPLSQRFLKKLIRPKV